eukprot:3103819-Pyramimonas_sp.AAC.1
MMMMMMMMMMISQSPRPRGSGFTRRWVRIAGACSKSVTGLTSRSISGWSPRKLGRIWFASFSRSADRPPIARRFTAGFQDVVARLAGVVRAAHAWGWAAMGYTPIRAYRGTAPSWRLAVVPDSCSRARRLAPRALFSMRLGPPLEFRGSGNSSATATPKTRARGRRRAGR